MAKQWDPLTEMPDLQGKVAVVTGASTGVGFATARLLAQHGAKVYATTRSESSAHKAQLTLQKYTGIDPNNIEWLTLELSDLKSIDAAARELSKRESKVDILINNAAVSTRSTELVAGKWEQHMGTNVAGLFLLVNRVLPLLKNAVKGKDADVRIINLSSIAHVNMLPRNFNFQFDSANCLRNPVLSYPWQWRYLGRFLFGFDLIRYAVSKAAVVIFTTELQRQLDEQGLPITAVAVHPGEVVTEGLLSVNNAFIKTVASLSFLTPEQGAATSLFAATAKEVRQNVEKYKGMFIIPVGKIETPHPVSEDKRQVRGLWENTTMEINKQLGVEGLSLLQAW